MANKKGAARFIIQKKVPVERVHAVCGGIRREFWTFMAVDDDLIILSLSELETVWNRIAAGNVLSALLVCGQRAVAPTAGMGDTLAGRE